MTDEEYNTMTLGDTTVYILMTLGVMALVFFGYQLAVLYL